MAHTSTAPRRTRTRSSARRGEAAQQPRACRPRSLRPHVLACVPAGCGAEPKPGTGTGTEQEPHYAMYLVLRVMGSLRAATAEVLLGGWNGARRLWRSAGAPSGADADGGAAEQGEDEETGAAGTGMGMRWARQRDSSTGRRASTASRAEVQRAAWSGSWLSTGSRWKRGGECVVAHTFSRSRMSECSYISVHALKVRVIS
jgi:hypothetical protein